MPNISVHGFMHETNDFLLYNNVFIYQVLWTPIYRRRSLYSFLSSIFDEIAIRWMPQHITDH